MPFGDALAGFLALFNVPLVTVTAPALAGGGLLYALLLWVPTRAQPARIGLALGTVVLMMRYLFWRYTETLPNAGWTADWIAGLAFAVIETIALSSAALSLLFLSGVRDRSAEVDAHQGWIAEQPKLPRIDVFVCTYNEEERLLERTIVAALGLNYPNFRVWILDDGRRVWLRKLATRVGCGYITRATNVNAKAGNINHALSVVDHLADRPDFIMVLDADFAPTADFLNRTLPLFHDEGVGIVQTPQHFLNPDPIQANMGLTGSWPDEQRYFFDIVMPAKDAWGCAFCCGTSSVIRYAALAKLGGMPTDSITEDYLLTLRLNEIGYSTAYLNEPLSFGLAPEGLKEYVTQRGRWCLGFMQIVRGPSGPFSWRRPLSFIGRLSLIEAFLNWTFVYLYKVAGIIVPLLYLLFGIKALQVPLLAVLSAFLPYYLLHSLTLAWISRGRVVPVMSDVAQLLTAPPALKAAFLGLLGPRALKFHVTAKGGKRETRFIEWPLLRAYLLMLLLSITAILFAFTFSERHLPVGEAGLALFWTWYNIVVLFILCVVCIEQPRLRRSGRFPMDETAVVFSQGRGTMFRLRDISITGAQFAGAIPSAVGSPLLIRVGNSLLRATIVRAGKGSFAVRFDNSLRTRMLTIRHIYSAMHDRTVRQIGRAPLVRALIMRAWR